MKKTCVVLLRGINVGGKNRMKMKDLTLCLERTGATSVATYLQSGNVVLEWEGGASEAMEEALREAIAEELDLDVSIMACDASEWRVLCANNPYEEEAGADAKSVHVVCLARTPEQGVSLESFERACTRGERFALVGDALYVHYPEGAGRSKLSHALFERVLGPCTARNWRTAIAIERMCEAP